MYSVSLASFSKLLVAVAVNKLQYKVFECTCYRSFQYHDIYNNRDNKLHITVVGNQYHPTLGSYCCQELIINMLLLHFSFQKMTQFYKKAEKELGKLKDRHKTVRRSCDPLTMS